MFGEGFWVEAGGGRKVVVVVVSHVAQRAGEINLESGREGGWTGGACGFWRWLAWLAGWLA